MWCGVMIVGQCFEFGGGVGYGGGGVGFQFFG